MRHLKKSMVVWLFMLILGVFALGGCSGSNISELAANGLRMGDSGVDGQIAGEGDAVAGDDDPGSTNDSSESGPMGIPISPARSIRPVVSYLVDVEVENIPRATELEARVISQAMSPTLPRSRLATSSEMGEMLDWLMGTAVAAGDSGEAVDALRVTFTIANDKTNDGIDDNANLLFVADSSGDIRAEADVVDGSNQIALEVGPNTVLSLYAAYEYRDQTLMSDPLLFEIRGAGPASVMLTHGENNRSPFLDTKDGALGFVDVAKMSLLAIPFGGGESSILAALEDNVYHPVMTSDGESLFYQDAGKNVWVRDMLAATETLFEPAVSQTKRRFVLVAGGEIVVTSDTPIGKGVTTMILRYANGEVAGKLSLEEGLKVTGLAPCADLEEVCWYYTATNGEGSRVVKVDLVDATGKSGDQVSLGESPLGESPLHQFTLLAAPMALKDVAVDADEHILLAGLEGKIVNSGAAVGQVDGKGVWQIYAVVKANKSLQQASPYTLVMVTEDATDKSRPQPCLTLACDGFVYQAQTPMGRQLYFYGGEKQGSTPLTTAEKLDWDTLLLGVDEQHEVVYYTATDLGGHRQIYATNALPK